MTDRRRWRAFALLLSLGVVGVGCGASTESATTTSTTIAITAEAAAPATDATTAATATTVPPATTIPGASAPTTTAAPRRIHEQAWTPFAAVGPVTLVHPSSRVEMVAFHQSNHDGAQQQQPLPTAVSAVTLESRQRDTGLRGAADIVADPDVEIRAPVSGRVKRAGSYVLYCDHRDHYVVVEPGGRPGWEVKLLHISGLNVRAGDRVEAGITVIAPGPRRLPFESQVDELTAEPPWPHVHIEVVDPSVRDRPTPGGC